MMPSSFVARMRMSASRTAPLVHILADGGAAAKSARGKGLSGPSPAPKIGHRQGTTERPTRVRDATKQVLFLLALVLSLAALVAVVSWRLAEARRQRPLPSPAPAAPADSP